MSVSDSETGGIGSLWEAVVTLVGDSVLDKEPESSRFKGTAAAVSGDKLFSKAADRDGASLPDKDMGQNKQMTAPFHDLVDEGKVRGDERRSLFEQVVSLVVADFLGLHHVGQDERRRARDAALAVDQDPFILGEGVVDDLCEFGEVCHEFGGVSPWDVVVLDSLAADGDFVCHLGCVICDFLCHIDDDVEVDQLGD
ncbi:hypothetical protein OGAPHI_002934 [Ogataea philodendri]|uniref:Uncharacterized protein n=1 Tax=Ogataea philodendri TaxID=1378263 RepID=A0A9P8P947_9ASCO|nr:uncharacterized protein OGAPHI_002934 [Ogataea philodendri]KAH3667285.1 hypothetical protein OGAPHI_002934 [Ogataea philodendri]